MFFHVTSALQCRGGSVPKTRRMPQWQHNRSAIRYRRYHGPLGAQRAPHRPRRANPSQRQPRFAAEARSACGGMPASRWSALQLPRTQVEILKENEMMLTNRRRPRGRSPPPDPALLDSCRSIGQHITVQGDHASILIDIRSE